MDNIINDLNTILYVLKSQIDNEIRIIDDSLDNSLYDTMSEQIITHGYDVSLVQQLVNEEL